jgi:hypothetical protein
MPANINAVAFTPPMTCTTSANVAGYRQPPSRSAFRVKPMSHGSAANGSSSTEIRAE